MPRCSGVSSLFLVSELIIWVTIMDCITKTTFDFDLIPVLYQFFQTWAKTLAVLNLMGLLNISYFKETLIYSEYFWYLNFWDVQIFRGLLYKFILLKCHVAVNIPF